MRAAVPHQVELNIAPAPIELEFALFFTVNHVHAATRNRHVGGKKSVGHALHHGKAALRTQFLKIIKKYATNAALLLAVFQKKVVITPSFETWVLVFSERGQRVVTSLMKVHRIFLKSVIRRQVHSTAKPAHRCAAIKRGGDDHADIHVHRRHIRVARVKHQRHTQRLEGCARQLGPVLRG